MKLPRLHLLPVLVAVASFVLVVKLGGMVQVALAQNAPPPQAPKAAAAPAATPAAPAGAAPAPTPIPVAVEGPLLPLGFSPEELAVLQELSARRRTLDEREAAITMREGAALAAEKRIEVKLAELAALKKEVEGLVRKVDDQDEKEIASLVKVYETMKPKDAARILEQVEFPVLVRLMERFKERSTAAILAGMSEPIARRLTGELARRRELKTP